MSKQVKEEKLPLQSRKFYLDINGPDLKKQLVYCVKKLGGVSMARIANHHQLI